MDNVFLPYLVNFGPYTLNTMTNMVVQQVPDGADNYVPLTRFEALILEHLAANAGQVVHRDALHDLLYGKRESLPSSNGLEVFVRRLRRKLDPDRGQKLIETVRGQGYQLRKWEAVAEEKAA